MLLEPVFTVTWWWYQVVAPKRQSLEQAESVYEEHMSKLRVKQAELQAVTDKLNNLNDNLDTKQNEKKVGITRICSHT